MSFKTINNQPMAVELAQRWLAKKTTQPMVFYGPEGAAKRALAVEIGKALNCNKRTEDSGLRTENIPHSKNSVLSTQSSALSLEGCGSCLPCSKIAAGKHADVRVVDLALQAAQRGEPLEKQQSLRIETILDERKRLYQTPVEGTWKVSVIDDAHRFTPDAANVLLKILEEPPPCTAIFLLTPYRDRILSTLLSRCQPVRFRPLSETDARKALMPDQTQALTDAAALWDKLPRLTPGQILSRPEARSRTPIPKSEMEAQLQALLVPALRDMRQNPAGRALEKVQLIQQAQQQLRQNVPPALVYEHLLMKLSAESASQ